jgi:cbb3-type cytochrome oxidase subunit 3
MLSHFSTKLAVGSDYAASQQPTLQSGSGTTFAGFIGNIIGVIDALIPLLISVAMVIFFVGLIQYIYNSGDAHGHGKSKELILWGLVALFVLMSLWGILDLAKTSIFPTA